MTILKNSKLALLMVLASCPLAFGAGSPAWAHKVVCTNDAQDPYKNYITNDGRKPLRGATIIDCAPTVPDRQRTSVQLQRFYGYWQGVGRPHVVETNVETFRVIDTTDCPSNEKATYRTYADHDGEHRNRVRSQSVSDQVFISCPY